MWAFVSELCAERTYRGAQAITGLSKETLRKYVERIGEPHRSTHKRLAEVFLQFHPEGYVATSKKYRVVKFSPVLPPGEEAARTALAKFFEMAKRHVDELPPGMDLEAMHNWLDVQIEAEYWPGPRYDIRKEWRRERRARQRRATASGEPSATDPEGGRE